MLWAYLGQLPTYQNNCKQLAKINCLKTTCEDQAKKILKIISFQFLLKHPCTISYSLAATAATFDVQYQNIQQLAQTVCKHLKSRLQPQFHQHIERQQSPKTYLQCRIEDLYQRSHNWVLQHWKYNIQLLVAASNLYFLFLFYFTYLHANPQSSIS